MADYNHLNWAAAAFSLSLGVPSIMTFAPRTFSTLATNCAKYGQSETLISVWRQMEAVQRGFKTPQGRLHHLKLFQITHYLKLPL